MKEPGGWLRFGTWNLVGCWSEHAMLSRSESKQRNAAGRAGVLAARAGALLGAIHGWWTRRERPSYVGLFHDLPVMWGASRGEEDDSSWFERDLPALLGRLAAQRPVADRFDSIVVD
jgi:hypothetical protein